MDTEVNGRTLQQCSIYVRALHVAGSHWAVAVWSRVEPTTVYLLDSMLSASLSQHPHVTHLAEVTGAKTVWALNVAEQMDSHSCGLFAIAFMFCIASVLSGGMVQMQQLEQQLLAVSVEGVREKVRRLWCNKLAREEDLTA